MTRNVGTIDRFVRFGLAAVLFSLFGVLEGNLRFIGLIGFIPLLTGAVSFCPLYRMLGINTCSVQA